MLKRLLKRLRPVVRSVVAPAISNPVERSLRRKADQGKEILPCHYNELFVNSKGDVFPCCKVWSRDDLRIGNVTDEKILDKVRSFDPHYCSCDPFVLRKARRDDEPAYKRLNLELSLLCQATCAMCCVGSPGWRGEYDLYADLRKLVAACQPSIELLVQGGEVLVQKESIKWLEEIRKEFPAIRIALVTNGSFGPEMADTVEDLFYRTTVSMVGFQPETYERIMGLRVERTKKFSERLIRGGKTKVFLKYLTTPINLHEVSLFLQWAIDAGPRMVQVIDSGLEQYIERETFDRYWDKILERTGRQTRRLLVARKEALRAGKQLILIDGASMEYLGISREFLAREGLEESVQPAELYPDQNLVADEAPRELEAAGELKVVARHSKGISPRSSRASIS